MSFNQSSPGLPDPSQYASTATALTASFPPGGSQIPYAKKLFLAWAADAYEKDRQQGHSGPQMDRVKQVVATLVSLSVKCKSDTSEYTRKQRMTTNKLFTLWVINLWCKLTFKMETFGLMKNMIRNIDQVKLPMEDMPKSYIVTWHYYRGQFHLWQGELIEAAKNLTLAFEKCTRKDRKNKIRILRPLIIVRVMLGRFPQTALLLKYGMSQEFIACLLAVAKGNVVRFDEYMEASFDELRRWTAWSLVNGKWPIMMWRTFISRCCLLSLEFRQPNIHHLSLQFVHSLYERMRSSVPDSRSVSLIELGIIVGNLIDQGFIRGYVSFATMTLVMPRENAFPSSKNVYDR